VRFWDTSAIVPVCVQEPASPDVKAILVKDSGVVVWWATRTECVSALTRQVREGMLTGAGEQQAREVLEALSNAWVEVQPSETLRRTAERLLAVHPLRAADAFQLAPAFQWCRGQPAGNALVSFDARVREAGRREGFGVLPAEA